MPGRVDIHARVVEALSDEELEKLFLYALSWTVGGLLEAEDRAKWDAHLRGIAPKITMPQQEEPEKLQRVREQTEEAEQLLALRQQIKALNDDKQM